MRLRIFCSQPGCGCPVDVILAAGVQPEAVACPACAAQLVPVLDGLVLEPGVQPIHRCPHCGGGELYVRKDFPQKLGLALVVIAGLASVVLFAMDRLLASMGVLIAVLIVDAAIYGFVPRLTACYRCRAEIRDHPLNPGHAGFDLATAEKYR